MNHVNSYASYGCPLFVNPWQQYKVYLDTDLNDLESMLDDSCETEVFPSDDKTETFTSDDETQVFSSDILSNVTHQEQPNNTTTNNPLLCNVQSHILQV